MNILNRKTLYTYLIHVYNDMFSVRCFPITQIARFIYLHKKKIYINK